MQNRKKIFSCAICALLICAILSACNPSSKETLGGGDFTSVPASSAPAPITARPADLGALKYRGMWISYLEWASFDTSNAEAFTASMATLFDNCKALGVNVVIFQVRPFGDAVYPSELFPWSHLVTGTQGQDPGYDPLALAVEAAHARDISIEAWINPYRVRLNDKMPTGELAANNPALTHEGWAIEAESGLYYDPSSPEINQYIVQGVEEIVRNYDIDGVQFDDYFYPTTDAAFDADGYAKYGAGKELATWRRENVSALVKSVHDAVKAIKPDVIFGISPQGNNDNNYNGQYSDVGMWMSTAGYVDYIMPQVYWGYDFTLKNGSKKYAFENITAEWAAMPRDASVRLTFGLGCYRIGAGDSGAQDQAQWSSGHNLADMVKTMSETTGVDGFALYRYDSLYHNPSFVDLANAEIDALKSVLTV